MLSWTHSGNVNMCLVVDILGQFMETTVSVTTKIVTSCYKLCSQAELDGLL